MTENKPITHINFYRRIEAYSTEYWQTVDKSKLKPKGRMRFVVNALQDYLKRRRQVND